MANIPTMEEMLKAGVHFGHQASRWHPKMQPYIYTIRNGVHVIDLKKTQAGLEKACEFVKKLVEEGGDVLFAGTKVQAQPLLEKYAKECSMPYVKSRWLGGTLTNFGEIKKVIKHYLELLRQRGAGEWEKYTKKEQIELKKEVERLEATVSGLAKLENLPQAIFIVDIRHEKTAVAEANVKGIPIVGVCDTNTNPSKIDYVVPANDDATRGIELLVKAISEACGEGLKNRKVVLKERKEDVKKVGKKKISEEAKKISEKIAAFASRNEGKKKKKTTKETKEKKSKKQ